MSDTGTKTEPKTPGIEIIGAEDMASSRGIWSRGTVAPETLRTNLHDLLQKLDSVMLELPAKVGAYTPTEITLAVSISAKGKLALLGSGGEVGGQAGITIKLVRKGKNDSNKDSTEGGEVMEMSEIGETSDTSDAGEEKDTH